MMFFARWRRSPFDVVRYEPVDVPDRYIVSWCGSIIRKSFDQNMKDEPERTRLGIQPRLDEELFEWHSLASAIRAARGRFTFIELGAGFGRWAVSAAVACRRLALPCELIAVEAEPNHFVMMKQHFADNGLDWSEHRLIEAAISAKAGSVHFTVGSADRWWGQAILPSADYGFGDVAGVTVQSVPAVTLADILETVAFVDLIDIDIQGAEADVIEAGLPALTAKVRRLHIGTHKTDIEERIRVALAAAGWRRVWDFPCNSRTRTPYGHVTFQDGVQAWFNSRV
jgi:FkbM family methyltransferase